MWPRWGDPAQLSRPQYRVNRAVYRTLPSARAAARRQPRSSIGNLMASMSDQTSRRAVTCNRLGRSASVIGSRLSSAVKPRGKIRNRPAVLQPPRPPGNQVSAPIRSIPRRPAACWATRAARAGCDRSDPTSPLAPRLRRHFGIMAYFIRVTGKVAASTHPSTSKSTKRSLSGVTSVSAMVGARRLRYVRAACRRRQNHGPQPQWPRQIQGIQLPRCH